MGELRWERMGTNVLTDWMPASACSDRRGSKPSTKITLWPWLMGWGRYLSMTAPMTWSCPAMGSPLGRFYPTAIPEILRVMRPGGYLLWTMREGYQQKSQRFALMDAELTDLTSSGAAEMVVGPVVFDNFVLDHPGRFYMMRKAPSVHPAMSEHYNV